MRILHISDLHLKTDFGRKYKGILKRVCDFLEENAKRKPFSHIVFTGDLRDTKDSSTIDEAISIVEQIALAANVKSKGCVHIIPGNHDLTRVGSEDDIAKIRREYDFDNGTFSDYKSSFSIMTERFKDFFWPLCERYYGLLNPWGNENGLPHKVRVDDENAFILTNSCLTCIDNGHDGNLVIGLNYLSELIEKERVAKRFFILAHHPIQNLHSREEHELQAMIASFPDKRFFWLCGDAHNNRASAREYITSYQVGSLVGISSTVPDFAIYDVADGQLERRVFRFLPHLNFSSANKGGWKRVFIDSKSPSVWG